MYVLAAINSKLDNLLTLNCMVESIKNSPDVVRLVNQMKQQDVDTVKRLKREVNEHQWRSRKFNVEHHGGPFE